MLLVLPLFRLVTAASVADASKLLVVVDVVTVVPFSKAVIAACSCESFLIR